MNNYLTKKLGEEGSEVAQAAFKNLLHHDKAARQDFLGEVADLAAMVDILLPQLSSWELKEFQRHKAARLRREQQKGKAWPKRK
jgi:phosphoribosyl-ATP pyrophosphohydrolase